MHYPGDLFSIYDLFKGFDLGTPLQTILKKIVFFVKKIILSFGFVTARLCE